MTPVADTVTGKVYTTYTCHCCFTLMFNSAFSHVFGSSSLQITWICTSSLTWFWTISIITPNKIYYTMIWKHAVFIFRWTLNLVCWHQLNKLFKWLSQRVWCQGGYVGHFHWPVFSCPNTNMPDYSLRPLIDCIYGRGYFHLVESTSEPLSYAIFLQHNWVWLCSPIVLMSGIWILYAECSLQLSCIICTNHQWHHPS